MKILVCIKQVPQKDAPLKLNEAATWIREDVSYEVNEPDAYALEEALRQKEKHGGEVVVITAGPARAQQTLREALAKATADELPLLLPSTARGPFPSPDTGSEVIPRGVTLARWIVPALVLPGGIDAEESAEIAMTFAVLGVKRLIPTRLDFSRHLGGILSAAERAKLSFTEASHTPQVAQGILTLTPTSLTALLMPPSPKKK